MKLPQLHLRDLFWLVLVAALCCAWWLDRIRIAERAHELAQGEERVELEKEENHRLFLANARKVIDLSRKVESERRRIEEERAGRIEP